jgi:molybdate transport system substrate-binding protein
MRRWLLAGLLALGVTAYGVTACGGDDAGGGDAAAKPRLVVSAAASLKDAFTDHARRFAAADVRLSFAGSDELAAQIRRGVEPDVFAAANVALPEQLAREGLVERPRVFAGNELVIAVPAGAARVDGLADLARPGTTIAIGAQGVPVGDYTRRALARLDGARRERILANVRSTEPDVGGVVGKLGQGAVDAGFVYRSDVAAADGRLEAIALPDRLRPRVAYAIAVVMGAARPREARAFVDDLVRGAGARALRDHGLLPPPGP